jgi:hypothetical protein
LPGGTEENHMKCSYVSDQSGELTYGPEFKVDISQTHILSVTDWLRLVGLMPVLILHICNKNKKKMEFESIKEYSHTCDMMLPAIAQYYFRPCGP